MNDIVERANKLKMPSKIGMKGQKVQVDKWYLVVSGLIDEVEHLRAENERLCRDNDRLLVLFKDAQICRDMK